MDEMANLYMRLRRLGKAGAQWLSISLGISEEAAADMLAKWSTHKPSPRTAEQWAEKRAQYAEDGWGEK